MNWRDHAACIGHEATFDAADAQGSGPVNRARREAIRDAKAICASCPVAVECTTEALEWEGAECYAARYSIWGGLTGAERVAIRHRADRQPISPPDDADNAARKRRRELSREAS